MSLRAAAGRRLAGLAVRPPSVTCANGLLPLLAFRVSAPRGAYSKNKLRAVCGLRVKRQDKNTL
jgi:hypothetical protein